MARLNSNTSTPLGYATGNLQSALSALIANMQAGKSITAADMQQLISLYNQFITHYHSVHDLVGIDTHGNYSVYGGGGKYVDHNTGWSQSGSSVSMAIPVGKEVTANDINTMVTALNSIRSHDHYVLNELQPAFTYPVSGGWTREMGWTWYSFAPGSPKSSSAVYPTFLARVYVSEPTTVYVRGSMDDTTVDLQLNGVSTGLNVWNFGASYVSVTPNFTIPAGLNEIVMVGWNRGGGRTAGAFQVYNASNGALLTDVGGWYMAPV